METRDQLLFVKNDATIPIGHGAFRLGAKIHAPLDKVICGCIVGKMAL
jgi:hypothetical protein